MAINFISQQSELEKILPFLARYPAWGFDTETTGLDPFTDKVIAVQLGMPQEQFVIDARVVNLEPLRPFFENKEYKKVAHNASFDWIMMMSSFGIDVESIRCTMFAEQLMHVGRKFSGFGLDKILENRLGVTMSKIQRKTFENHKGPYTEAQIRYMALDVQYLLPLCTQQCEDLIADNLGETWKLECEAIAPFCSMELAGFNLDEEAWKKIIVSNTEGLEETRLTMNDFAKQYWETDMFGDVNINYGSPKQVLDLLHRMRVTVRLRNRQTGEEEDFPIPGTKDDLLRLVVDVPFVNQLQKYRKYAKAISTYGQTFLDQIRDDTGRIHFKLRQLGTETGRPASRKASSYNPLNIPRDKRYRHAFIATPDHVIETDDYSACELRIWAEQSEDPGLVEAFQRGLDIHSYVGTKLFGIEVSKTVNADKRQLTKPVNFGIAYGMGAWTLYYRVKGEGMDVTIEQMKELYRIYTKKEFAVGVKWLRDQGEIGFEQGWIDCLGGRRRYWLLPNPNNRETFPKGKDDQVYGGVTSKIKREAGNFKIQAVNSNMTKRAMRLIYDEVKKRKFRTEFKNMPYDEIVTMTHKDDSPEFVPIKRKLMIQAAMEYLKNIPMEVEGEVMHCWTK